MMQARPYVIDRIDGKALTELEFIERFEKPSMPAIFTHLMDDWPAYQGNTKWSTLAWLYRKFSKLKFKCGEDDKRCPVKIKLKYYLQYMVSTRDDSPLCVLDSNFGEDPKRKKLLNFYNVPNLFREDLFQHTREGKRPPYRWIVIGPPRSGTGIHIDRLATSAWNSLVRGAKRWCLLPNEVPGHLLKPQYSDNCGKQEAEAVTWFRFVHPRVTSAAWPAKWRPIEFVQLPGETVFIPGGWWHVVLNLDISVAITQNYFNTGNFKHVWLKTA
ncbi:bifunctional arginine demethylase and lysyl-hydroxylase JMJD6-B-like [Symsagittifera roscoffensis]|uniref:bifunctional arginine demethylase and lysyl-hydroxylase JMJD6-B-like n=1 Tax=Symsagittifera roscoffensis TaxID=84072 RepID=UPI00307BA5FF